MQIWPLRSSLHFNTGYSIRLMYAFPHWVLGWASATPIIPSFQYRIQYQADLCTHSLSIGLALATPITFAVQYSIQNQDNVSTHPLSIQWIFGHSDHSCISVPDRVWGFIRLNSNILLYFSLTCVITYLVLVYIICISVFLFLDPADRFLLLIA